MVWYNTFMPKPLISLGEWYHCYNRGVDKRKVFSTKGDYDRFLLLLYACNSTKPFHAGDFRDPSLAAIITSESFERGRSIVGIGAYALMPNHVHLVLKELQEGGIALFMQKVFTGFTMYFNKKNERTGSLFAGTYKARHVADDRYLKRVIPYVHCNPIGLIEPQWKEGRGNRMKIEEWLRKYPYSSLPDFLDVRRPENSLLEPSIRDLFEEGELSLKLILKDAQEYYHESSTPFPEV